MRLKKHFYFIFPALAVLALLLAGYCLSAILKSTSPAPSLDGGTAKPETLQQASPAREKIIRLRFPACGHLEPLPGGGLPTGLVELDFTALSREELAEALPPTWQVAAFSESQLILETEAQLCSICEQNRYLGVYRGKIAIYRGIPPGGVLERVTDYPVRDDVADQLEQGIPFKTTEDLLWLLESYTS